MLGSEQSNWPGKHFSFSQEKGQATSVLQQYRVSPGSGELCQLSSEVRLGPGEAKAFLATKYMKMNFQSRGRFRCSAFSGLYSMKVQSGCCLSRASCRQLLSPHTHSCLAALTSNPRSNWDLLHLLQKVCLDTVGYQDVPRSRSKTLGLRQPNTPVKPNPAASFIKWTCNQLCEEHHHHLTGSLPR